MGAVTSVARLRLHEEVIEAQEAAHLSGLILTG